MVTPPPIKPISKRWKVVPGGKVFTGDCLDMVSDLPDSCIDLVI